MLRGQASLQEIIGRPQSWRRSSKPRTLQKSDFAEEEAAAAQEAGRFNPPPTSSGKRRRGFAYQQNTSISSKGPDTHFESPFGSQEEQRAPLGTPNSQDAPRRSPRTKAKSQYRTNSSEQASSSFCPICDRQLPQDSGEINRHLGTLRLCLLTCAQGSLSHWPEHSLAFQACICFLFLVLHK